jgi:hypothetical protein
MAVFGGLFGASPNYAALAKRSEASRQGIINLGLSQINSVFGGGSAPFYTPALQPGSKFSGKNTYYFLNKRGQFAPYWSPYGGAAKGINSPNQIADLATDLTTLGAAAGLRAALPAAGLGNLFGTEESPRDIAKQKFRKGQLFNAPEYQTFEGFQPEFFQKRAQDYVNYALPQLAQQYQQNRNAVLYGLSNRGLGSSSVSTQAKSGLERAVGEGKQSIAESGIAQANQLKKDIESSRQEAINQLYQSADPARAFQSAISAASQFRQPSVFAPLADMFGNIAQQYYLNRLISGYQQGAAPAQGGMYDLSSVLGPVAYRSS